MSYKGHSSSKSSLFTRNSKTSAIRTDKIQRTPTPKKLIASKKLPKNCGESRSYSAGVANATKFTAKPKKTTKSDLSFCTKGKHSDRHDYCKNCGDYIKTSSGTKIRTQNNIGSGLDENIQTMISSMNERCVMNDNSVRTDKRGLKFIQQYYKNENFLHSTESVHVFDDNLKKLSLDTIREVPEAAEDSIYRVYTDSDEESDDTTLNSEETLSKLKEFRRKNYFECHSAKSRIKTKPSAINLKDHKCVYRFYLNDRLFPVPLNSDYNNRIRCVECHLPMDVKIDSSDKNINGTIQAKVKLGESKARDTVLLLPVKNTLIIEEKRRERKKPDEEVVYFGVIKLSSSGNSLFNRTLPENSFALKYQKGYKEFERCDKYNYKNLNDDDVIIV